jgi:hypothetical protein
LADDIVYVTTNLGLLEPLSDIKQDNKLVAFAVYDGSELATSLVGFLVPNLDIPVFEILVIPVEFNVKLLYALSEYPA